MKQVAHGDYLALDKNTLAGSVEEWKPVEGFEECYAVSNMGRVKITRKGRKFGAILSYGRNKRGYNLANLTGSDGVRKYTTAHRLVASHFIPNPKGLPEVNHKDGNKDNNHVDNLEWCTRKQNYDHGAAMGLVNFASLSKIINSRPVLQFNRDGSFVAEYPSITEAAQVLKCSERLISGACKGYRKFKNAKGFNWKFKEVTIKQTINETDN